jgi:hypothetical protein
MFASSEQVAVQRGLAEFRGGRPVLFLAREPFVAMPIDGCDQRVPEAFRQTFNTAPLQLAITARRASAFGIKTNGPVTLHLNVEAEVSEILSLAASSSVTQPLDASLIWVAHGLLRRESFYGRAADEAQLLEAWSISSTILSSAMRSISEFRQTGRAFRTYRA